MDRMRAARNNPKEEPHDQKIREPKEPKHIRKVKRSETPPKSVPEVTAKGTPAKISNELAGTKPPLIIQPRNSTPQQYSVFLSQFQRPKTVGHERKTRNKVNTVVKHVG